MTALEIFTLGVPGSGNDFVLVVDLLERLKTQWCLIGGVAVNAYVEPVYTADVDFVVVASELDFICAELAGLGFVIAEHPFSRNAKAPGSALVVQFTTDARYQAFLERAVMQRIYDVPCRVAALADLFTGKLWAAADPERRASKRRKDEADLLRIAETYSAFVPLLPPALRALLP
jgi:hypothetical protein